MYPGDFLQGSGDRIGTYTNATPTIPKPTTTIFLRWAEVVETSPSATASFGVALMAMPGDEVADDIFDNSPQGCFDNDQSGSQEAIQSDDSSPLHFKAGRLLESHDERHWRVVLSKGSCSNRMTMRRNKESQHKRVSVVKKQNQFAFKIRKQEQLR